MARILLGNAVAKLHGNVDQQVWLLGDRLATDVEALLAGGRDAPELARTAYLAALHRLAKARARVAEGLDDKRLKHQLDHWNPTSRHEPIDDDVAQTATAFMALAVGVPQVRLEAYRDQVSAMHASLPDVLARVSARSYHGTEQQIASRVRALLVDRYELNPGAVQDVIFRNLRGFINDVSKEPNRTFTQDEFEAELVQVWPSLVAPTQPRVLGADHLPRPELVRDVVTPAVAREIVGPSGSGKSSLASEVHAALCQNRRDAVVLFVEVRTRTTLRDVLIGVAHSLHRRGIGRVIGPALDLRASDTGTIERVAAALAGLTREIFLLIDCADSEIGNELRRDLAVFTRALGGTRFHLIGFAQQSIFRELTAVERSELAVAQAPMPGLNFSQFLALLGQRHPDIDRPAAHALFEKLSAGLPTGVLPNLVQQMARARSLAEMQEIVQRPPDQRLSAAHRDRFDSLRPGLRQAASRAVCLSLPLPAGELIALFPHDPMQGALQALVEEGLLAPFTDRVEMHETVRAGLESRVPPALATETHEALAAYFAQRGLLPAQIYHLEKAGRADDALRIARERFLAGRDWPDLVDYVGSRKCLSPDEVMALLLDESASDRYLLRDLLPRVQTGETAPRLLDILCSDPEQYRNDYHRTSLLQETLLKCDPRMLTPLVAFTLEHQDADHDRLGSLRTSAWRAEAAPDAAFMTWFRSQGLDVQKKSIGFLLLNPDLSRLKEALAFMHQHALPIAARGSHVFGLSILDLATDEEIEHFLEALPPAEPAKMLVSRTVLLGPFESYVWHQRVALRRVSRTLVQQGTAAPPVLANAVRVLVFVNDREVVPLLRRFRNTRDPVASLAWMAPVLLDAVEELPELEATARASDTTIEARVMAIVVAMHLGADGDRLLAQATAAKPDAQRGLETMLLLQAVFVPFPGAVPLLSAALDEAPTHHGIFGGVLARLAEADLPGTEALLVKASRTPDSGVIAQALVALGRGRFRGALAPILDIARGAEQAELRAFAIPAALASGPDSTSLFRDLWRQIPSAAHWRWVLAGRLRDADEASALVALATDAKQDWKLRRLAILAAGRLPFDAALAAIAPIILNTPVTVADESSRLHAHALLAGLLEAVGVPVLVDRFRRGRDEFVVALAPIYDVWASDLLDKRGVMPSDEAVGWLWDRLAGHGFERDPGLIDNVVNELHVPMLHAAVLLLFRRCGRRDDLFATLEHAPTNWLRIRAFIELCQGEPLSAEHEQRAHALMECAPLDAQPVLLDIFNRRPRSQRREPTQRSVSTRVPTAALRLDFENAQAFLRTAGRVGEAPIIVEVDERELRALADELDPANDTEWRPPHDAKPARVSLSASSWRLRGGFALEQTSPHHAQRSALRPAVAAANRFGIDIPWHRSALSGELRNVYADRLFANVGAQDDPDALVRILTDEAELVVPLLDEDRRVTHVLHLVDERLLPVLDGFVQAGHGVFFQQLCRLICRVDTDAVRRSLAKAFRRWLVLLDQLQASQNHAKADTSEWRVVWQTLSILRKHAHFDSIPHVRARLLEILIRHQQLWFGHREHILELLKDWPPAYLQFETEVFRQTDFDHHCRGNQVEIYDDIADALFRRVR
ncbi:MAG: ATP-binding protein [Vicinamibacterales bacterium]